MTGQVVAKLRTPLPVSDELVSAALAIQRLYGKPLVLLPFQDDDEFASLAVAD